MKHLEDIMPTKYPKGVTHIMYKYIIVPRKWEYWSEYKIWFVAQIFSLVVRNKYLHVVDIILPTIHQNLIWI